MKEQIHKDQEIFLHLQKPLNSIPRHSSWEWNKSKILHVLTYWSNHPEGRQTNA